MDIDVNPNVIRNSYTDAAAAQSYDGFWLILHEMFHRGPQEVFHDLTIAQNNYLLNGQYAAVCEDCDMLRPDSADETNWRIDTGYPSELGAVVSFTNVLRAGFGLPIRKRYGTSQSVIPFEASPHNKKQGAEIGVHRPADGYKTTPSADLSSNNYGIVDGLIDRHYTASGGQPWSDRLEKSTFEMDVGSDILNLSPDPNRTKIDSTKIDMHLTSSSPAADLHFTARWGVGPIAQADDGTLSLPAPDIGKAFCEGTIENEDYSGRGDFGTPPGPFYRRKQGSVDEYTDAGILIGVQSGIRSEPPWSYHAVYGHWAFWLGGSDEWSYSRDGFRPK